MFAGKRMIDSDRQILYHEWILKELRKMDETDKQTFCITDDQYKKSLADRNNLDSNGVEGK